MDGFAKLKNPETPSRTRIVPNLMRWRDVPVSHARHRHQRRSLHDSLVRINRAGLPGNIQSDRGLKVQATVVTTVQHVIAAASDGILCDVKTVAHHNVTSRTDRAVQRAFGRTGCAEQSTIARTLRTCTPVITRCFDQISWRGQGGKRP